MAQHEAVNPVIISRSQHSIAVQRIKKMRNSERKINVIH